jgi:hypothetical protein
MDRRQNAPVAARFFAGRIISRAQLSSSVEEVLRHLNL